MSRNLNPVEQACLFVTCKDRGCNPEGGAISEGCPSTARETHPGFLGFILLIRRHPREVSVFTAPLAVGLSAYFLGRRFMIFFTPVLGVGLGYAVAVLASRFADAGAKSVWIAAFIATGSLLYYAEIPRSLFQPTVHPEVLKGMEAVREKTPGDAIIWANWDQGYPLLFWGERTTLGDGGIMAPSYGVCLALPLATANFRLSANFMKFYSVRGMKGMEIVYDAVGGDRKKAFALIKDVLGAGPDQARAILEAAGLQSQDSLRTPGDWLRYFFPAADRPIYLFLDSTLTRTAETWYWAGTWEGSPKEGRRPEYTAFQGLRERGNEVFSGEGLRVDLKKGQGFAGEKMIRLSELLIRTNGGEIVRRRYGSRGSRLEILAPMGFGAVMDEGIAESVFNVLMLRHQPPPCYFRPVVLHAPYFQLWEVEGDSV